MSTFIETSVFFGVVVSLLAYGIGMLLKQRFHLGVFNPLLISIVMEVCRSRSAPLVRTGG